MIRLDSEINSSKWGRWYIKINLLANDIMTLCGGLLWEWIPDVLDMRKKNLSGTFWHNLSNIMSKPLVTLSIRSSNMFIKKLYKSYTKVVRIYKLIVIRVKHWLFASLVVAASSTWKSCKKDKEILLSHYRIECITSKLKSEKAKPKCNGWRFSPPHCGQYPDG